MRQMTTAGSYFTRTGPRTFHPTEHVSGGWNTAEQHVAPGMGLLAHAVEADRDARRDDGLVVGRLGYDILGTLPMDEVEVEVHVVRPGRTIELVEATLSHGGRPTLRLRAWLLQRHDSSALAGSPVQPLAPPEDPRWETWHPSSVWPGGFIASAELRRGPHAPGAGAYWVRTPVTLVEGEQVGRLAQVAALVDIANGMVARVEPEEALYPNIDLTAHLVREPAPGWLGLDTRVTFGPGGLGLTTSALHDEEGPLGVVSQVLTVRPR